MQEIQRGNRFIVIDNFLDKADFIAAQNLMNRARFTKLDSVISPADDGQAFRSKGVRFGDELGRTDASGRPKVYKNLARVVHTESAFYGRAGQDWDTIGFAFWKYPSGSRLGWHNDAGSGRRGEFILFLHNTWKPSWGGELMLIDEHPPSLSEENPGNDDPVLRIEILLSRCTTNPVAIWPRPNRLVLVQAETIHTIHRVDRTAGDFLRCTLTGFVSRDLDREVSRQNIRQKLETVLGNS